MTATKFQRIQNFSAVNEIITVVLQKYSFLSWIRILSTHFGKKFMLNLLKFVTILGSLFALTIIFGSKATVTTNLLWFHHNSHAICSKAIW